MRKHYNYTPLKTKDIRAIMQAVRGSGALTRIAYCRLHNYIVTLERLLQEESRQAVNPAEIISTEECLFLNN